MLTELPVCCVLGPTASGKTGLAVEMVERFPFEIISVDSALVYRGMDIGTAKPDAAVLARAPHALIDLVDPWQSYSVSQFLADADKQIQRICKAGRIPLMVGGTMLYFHSLWHGLTRLPPANEAVRAQLQRDAETLGVDALHDRLASVDPQSAQRIHRNDPQRLIRALEIYQLSGVTLTELQARLGRDSAHRYDFFDIGLYPRDRASLHTLIAERFDTMLKQGFEQEVAGLMADTRIDAGLASMRCVGYRQMWAHLAGECCYAVMRERAMAATRQLAKRQITWMRKMHNLQLVDPFDRPRDRVLEDPALRRWLERHRAAEPF